jgi:heme oxygenase
MAAGSSPDWPTLQPPDDDPLARMTRPRSIRQQASTGAAPTVLDRLRQETAPAHARLERRLDLLARPFCRDHLLGVLRGFHRFHAAWEPLMAALLGDVFTPRRRLHLVRADLRALGEAAISHEGPAPRLFASEAGAWGSLYVMEGSTLGGALIAQALAGVEGLPDRGIRYFSPYGRNTAAMWRDFRAGLLAASRPATERETIDAALATFALLGDWLPERFSGTAGRPARR